MPIKILQLVVTGTLSGAEKVVSDICTNLDKSKFIPITVCSGEVLKNYYLNKNIQSEIIDISKLNPKEIVKLRKLLIDKKIDIAHGHDVKASMALVMAAVGLKIPVFSHIHGNYQWLKDGGTFKTLDRIFRKRYHMSIACSKKVSEYYLKYNSTFDNKSLIIMENKFNFNEFAGIQLEDKNELKQKLNIDKDKFIFGYLGRLIELKGVDLLIESFNLLNKKYRDTMVVLVGEGDKRIELEKIVHKYNLQDNVLFLGYQSNVYDFLNIFDAFVLPSKTEGLPIAILEAMAMKKMVISTPTEGGIPEVIKTGQTGILLEERTTECLLESMEYVYLNQDKAESIGNEARKFIEEKFNIKDNIKALEALYEQSLLRNK